MLAPLSCSIDTRYSKLSVSERELPLPCGSGLVAQSCLTLCDPMDCSPPGSSVHEIFQARILKVGCHFLLQGNFLTQRSNPGLLHCRQSPALQVNSLLTEPPGKRLTLPYLSLKLCSLHSAPQTILRGIFEFSPNQSESNPVTGWSFCLPQISPFQLTLPQDCSWMDG